MSIQSQDKKAALTLVVLLAIWAGIGPTIVDLDILDTLLACIGMAAFFFAIYLIKRKPSYLSALVQKYAKQKDRKDLNMIAVQVAYGRYRLALVTFKVELNKDPENRTLQEIVTLMEHLENGNRIFT